MLPGGSRLICMIYRTCFREVDLYCTDPAQHLTTSGWDEDDLDLSSVQRGKFFT